MKKLFTTAVIAAICALGAPAQTMTIYAPDGTYTKYNTDYVQEVTFQEVSGQETVELTDVTVKTYSQGAADLGFSGTDISMNLFVLGPTDTYMLASGVYDLNGTNSPMTVDTDPNYTWVTVKGTRLSVQSGKMTVSNTGNEYTISMDYVLSDASNLKALYKGELPGYGPIYTLPATGCREVFKNDLKDGEFYLRFNDADWKYELTIDFFDSAEATTLTPGTYTWSDTPGPGNIGPDSRIDMYSPNFSYKLRGTVTVAREGEEYTIDMNLESPDGRKFEIGYKGEINFDTEK